MFNKINIKMKIISLQPFFNILIKDAKVTPRIRNAGHIVMYDKPKPVAYYINKFILDSYKAP